MATTSTQNHMPRGANGDSRLSRKRAAQQDDKTENPPAKVRKVDHSNHTPRHGHYPTMHPLQRKETRSIQEDEDTGYKASNSENSSSTTGYRYPNTPSTTPSTTPETSPNRGSSWWYRDSEGVHVFKVDDFTGRVRRRTPSSEPRVWSATMFANHCYPSRMGVRKNVIFRGWEIRGKKKEGVRWENERERGEGGEANAKEKGRGQKR